MLGPWFYRIHSTRHRALPRRYFNLCAQPSATKPTMYKLATARTPASPERSRARRCQLRPTIHITRTACKQQFKCSNVHVEKTQSPYHANPLYFFPLIVIGVTLQRCSGHHTQIIHARRPMRFKLGSRVALGWTENTPYLGERMTLG